MNYLSVSQMAKKMEHVRAWSQEILCRKQNTGCILNRQDLEYSGKRRKTRKNKQKSDEPQNLFERLRAEKKSTLKGGIDHKIQIELTYNSNHIEGSKLTHDQTRYIFETNTIRVENDTLNVDE